MVIKLLKKYFFVILALIIAAFGYVYILTVGKEYTYVRKDIYYGSGIKNVYLDKDSKGSVEILDWNYADGALTVRMRSVSPGKAYVMFDDGETPSLAVFYVHKNGVITYERFFGDCNKTRFTFCLQQ